MVDALNETGKPLKGSRVLVLGVAYKKDIDNVRESPALDVIELLRQKGADVRYHDPYVPTIRQVGFEMAGEADLDSHAPQPGARRAIHECRPEYSNDWHPRFEYSWTANPG